MSNTRHKKCLVRDRYVDGEEETVLSRACKRMRARQMLLPPVGPVRNAELPSNVCQSAQAPYAAVTNSLRTALADSSTGSLLPICHVFWESAASASLQKEGKHSVTRKCFCSSIQEKSTSSLLRFHQQNREPGHRWGRDGRPSLKETPAERGAWRAIF